MAILLLVLVVAISCATGGMTYIRIREAVDWKYTIALLGGFVIQVAAEEALCRGFLMQSLLKKISVPWAVFWVCLAIYLLLTSFINIRYFRRKRAIRKSNGYPARIIAVQSGTREYGGRYKATIGTYGLKVKYAEGVKCIFVSDCKIKQEVKDQLKFWL